MGLMILQVFRIIAPYIMLSVTSAYLTHILGLPPHSLLLIALSMADGTTYCLSSKLNTYNYTFLPSHDPGLLP